MSEFGLPDASVAKLHGVFARHPAIERAVIYGSRAKGNYKRGSDIDLTLIGTIADEELNRLILEIDDLLLPWMVDLSLFARLDHPSLIAHIERVGREFYRRREPG